MSEKTNAILEDLKDAVQWVGEKAAAAASALGRKTGETAEVAGINGRILKAEKEIKNGYRELGRAVYQNRGKAPEEQEDVESIIAGIDEQFLTIEELEAESAAVREKYAEKRTAAREAAAARAQARAEARSEAEAEDWDDGEEEIDIPTADAEPAAGVCPHCGTALAPEATYCPGCGAKL